MSLYLFIAAAIGFTIFILAYLAIVIASFRHHTVTGLIALIPAINLAVLPTIWQKTSKAFPLGILGLGLALATWYSGGYQYFHSLQTGKPVIASEPSTTAPEKQPAEQVTTRNVEEVPLPDKPLYYLVYQKVESNDLASLVGQQVRVTLIDGQQLEGKNIKTSNQSVFIESSDQGNTQTLKVALQHIQTLEKLARVQN